MFITGYHGTTKENAEHILSTRKFYLSKGEKEWLGSGIYFYPDLNDAYEWRDSEVFLHAVIKITQDEYLDLDTEDGKEVYRSIINSLCNYTEEEMVTKGINISDKNVIKNQCAVANALWDTFSELKVIFASFHKERTQIPTLIDARIERREFCVRNNDCIISVQKIERSELE